VRGCSEAVTKLSGGTWPSEPASIDARTPSGIQIVRKPAVATVHRVSSDAGFTPTRVSLAVDGPTTGAK
jgi:hypothetical protein